MIVAVYCPFGIVSATFREDFFIDIQGDEERPIYTPVRVTGLPHVITLWNCYAFVYSQLSSTNFDNRLSDLIQNVMKRWNEPPVIAELMPYIKKMLMDNEIQVIGIVSGYYSSGDISEPFVYQILGYDIHRINMSEEGSLQYNYMCLEKKTVVRKLLAACKLENGEIWEEYGQTRIRCDLFSIEKAIDFCKFMLNTNRYVNNLNVVMYDEPLPFEMTIVTPQELKILKNNTNIN